MPHFKTKFIEQTESKFHTNLNSNDDVYEKILNSIKTPYIGENGNWYEWDMETQTFIDTGIKSVGKDGYTPQKDIDYFDGDPGYTPVRGTDYWTEEDKAEIKSYVDEAILGGAW